MKKLNKAAQLTLLLSLTYMISYITRVSYGTVISEIEKNTHIAKSLLAHGLTGSFITYGAGQIISGILGDRFSAKRLISFGLALTTVMNILIPFCASPLALTVIMCINGFAQSLMWPPMVKIMTVQLSDDEYKSAVVKVSWGSSAGTITTYLFSPVIITFFGWKAVFVFCAVCGLMMLLLWNRFGADAESSGETAAESAQSGLGFISPLFIGIMLAIVFQGMLRDGVTTWMPSYIAETYNISNVIAILSGVILPIFGILCFQAASVLYRKCFTNPLACAAVIFACGGAAAFLLLLITGKSMALSVLLSAILTGCMHGVNLILICMIPPFYKKYGNVSTVSGVLNSCTYIGSAISSYGIAVLCESAGWHTTLAVWLLIAVLGTVMCAANIFSWKRVF